MGVPTTLPHIMACGLLNPRSVILPRSISSNSTFLSLMSLCTRSRLCRYLKRKTNNLICLILDGAYFAQFNQGLRGWLQSFRKKNTLILKEYPLKNMKCARKPCTLRMRWKLILITPCQIEITSDQTEIKSLSRWLFDHGPDQTQTLVHTIVRSTLLLIRLLCALNCLWSIPLEIFWSVNGFHFQRISLIFLYYFYFNKIDICRNKLI